MFEIPIPAMRIAAREIKLKKLAKLSRIRWIKLVVFSGKRILIFDDYIFGIPSYKSKI